LSVGNDDSFLQVYEKTVRFFDGMVKALPEIDEFPVKEEKYEKIYNPDDDINVGPGTAGFGNKSGHF